MGLISAAPESCQPASVQLHFMYAMWLLYCLVSNWSLGPDWITCPTAVHCLDTTIASRSALQSPRVSWRWSLTRSCAEAVRLPDVHACLMNHSLFATFVAAHDWSQVGTGVNVEKHGPQRACRASGSPGRKDLAFESILLEWFSQKPQDLVGGFSGGLQSSLIHSRTIPNAQWGWMWLCLPEAWKPPEMEIYHLFCLSPHRDPSQSQYCTLVTGINTPKLGQKYALSLLSYKEKRNLSPLLQRTFGWGSSPGFSASTTRVLYLFKSKGFMHVADAQLFCTFYPKSVSEPAWEDCHSFS